MWRKCPQASGGVRKNDEMLQDLMVRVLATKSSWQRVCSGQGFALDTGLPALSGIPFLSFPFLDKSVVRTSFWTTTVAIFPVLCYYMGLFFSFTGGGVWTVWDVKQ